MTQNIFNMADDTDFTTSVAAQGRDSGSWRRTIWSDAGKSETIVAVWKAEPGVYSYPARPLEETFVVCEGEAMCTLDEAGPAKIKPGSIVRVPQGVSITLEVLTPFRKLATVVPRS